MAVQEPWNHCLRSVPKSPKDVPDNLSDDLTCQPAALGETLRGPRPAHPGAESGDKPQDSISAIVPPEVRR